MLESPMMKLDSNAIYNLIKFARRIIANNVNRLEVDVSGSLGFSSDEAGEDCYYEVVTLFFEDEDGEEQQFHVFNTTIDQAGEVVWGTVHNLEADLSVSA
jgi:hypothetical protein